MDRRERTRKITYAAVCTAIAVAVVAVSTYSPARIVPLIGAALGIYVAFVRCGIGYGIVCGAATGIIGFILAGLTPTFIFLVVVFIPFAVLAYFLRKLSYNVTWQAIVRIAASATFFAVTLTVIVVLTDFVAETSLMVIIDRVGKAITIVLAVAATLPVDLFFAYLADRVIKFLK